MTRAASSVRRDAGPALSLRASGATGVATRAAHRLVWWLVLALVLAAARLPTFQMWGDVRYSLGVERTTARTGWASWEVWAHRPLLNRVLMAALDHATAGSQREQQILLLSALGCGVATWALYRSLRCRLGGTEAAGLSVAVLAALIWAPPSTVLQPEWYALVLAVGAVAAGTARRHASDREEWRVALVTALLLSLTVLMKWTTAGTAATAWLVAVVWCWPRQRARVARITAATLVVLPALLALQVLLVPHEGLWLVEMPQLNRSPSSLVLCPLLEPPRAECGLQAVLLNTAIASPLLLLLPAAVVVLVGTSRGPRRVAALVVPLVGVLAAVVTVVVQAQWFSYHYAAAPVLAAGWAGWALVRWWVVTGRPAWFLLVPMAATGLVVGRLLSLPLDVRTSSASGAASGWSPGQLVLGFAILVVLLSCVLTGAAVSGLRRPPRRSGRRPTAAAALTTSAVAVGIALSNPLLPDAAYAWDHGVHGKTATGEHGQRAKLAASGAQIRAAIGADTPVVYLAFGERSYWVGNPTYCRYAAATFLQRSVYVSTHHLRSFAENLDCLSDPRAAFVVVEENWLKLHRVDRAVPERLAAEFDCARPAYRVEPVVVCPRRG